MSDFDRAEIAKAVAGGIVLALGLWAFLFIVVAIVPGPRP